MAYRITADMIFEEEDPALDILDKIKDHQDQAITLHPGQPNEEKSHYQYQECHHDDPSLTPCSLMDEWESNG